MEENDLVFSPARVEEITEGIFGSKRTTGQHPGGIIVIPDEYEIEDFTPVNYPADDPNSGVITTHFTYNSLHETILKLDLLGHDVPSIIKMLSDFTKTDPNEIPLTDKETMSIFSNTDALKLYEEIPDLDVGTLGIPEFGTKFVRGMLSETKPSTFSELIRISGLSHGTDVWLNNAQLLIKEKRAVLSEVICTRDDIMTFLCSKGLENNLAFTIMESVRKEEA